MAVKKVIEIEVEGEESVEEITQALEDMGHKLTKVKNTSKEAFDEVEKGSKDASREAGFFSDKMDGIRSITGKLKADFSNAFMAVKGFGKGLGLSSKAAKGLAISLSALGIPILLMAVGALIEYFKNFEAGQKALQKVINATAAVFGQLGSAFSALVRGDFSAMKEALAGIGDAIGDSVEATEAQFKANKELSEMNQRMVKENAKLRQDMEANKKILEDTTLSTTKRLEALDKVTDATKQLLENETELANKRVEALEAELANENSYERQRELREEIATIQAELIDKETALKTVEYEAGKQRREIEKLDKQAAKDAVAAAKEKAKKIDDAEKELEKKRKERHKEEMKRIQEERDQLEEDLDFVAELELQAAEAFLAMENMSSDVRDNLVHQFMLLPESMEAALQGALDSKRWALLSDKVKEIFTNEELLELQQANFLGYENKGYEAFRNLITAQITEAERFKELEGTLRQAGYEERIVDYDRRILQLKQLLDAETLLALDTLNKIEDFEKKKYEARFTQVMASAQFVGNVLSSIQASNEEDAKAMFKITKGINLAMAVASTANAVIGALAPSGADAALPFYVRAGNALSAAATGAAQIGTIANQQFGKSLPSTPGPDGGSTIAPIQPQFNLIGQQGNLQLGGIIRSGKTDQVLKAYVVEKDITSAQELQRQIDVDSAFG